MTTWEYHILQRNGDTASLLGKNNWASLPTWLKSLGEGGFELCGTYEDRFIFKKPIVEEWNGIKESPSLAPSAEFPTPGSPPSSPSPARSE